MGAAWSRAFPRDKRLGDARWIGCEGGPLLMPYWWVSLATCQVPLAITVFYCRCTAARAHRWVVAGCGALGALTCLFQLAACTTDPGILPREYHRPGAGAGEWEGKEVAGVAVRQRDRVVELANGEYAVLRWCSTCKLHRPPRAAHCDTLDCCVEEYDHFCPVLGACVGRRTLRYFVGYLASCGLLTTWTVGSTLYISHYHCGPGGRHRRDIAGVDNMFAATAFGGGAGGWTILMTCFYLRLLWTEHTYREDQRGLTNPLSHDEATFAEKLRSIWQTLCGRLPRSRLVGGGGGAAAAAAFVSECGLTSDGACAGSCAAVAQ